ncbi:MAG TPA: hypothetical protein VI341_04810 [Actinomycetota bacterium]
MMGNEYSVAAWHDFAIAVAGASAALAGLLFVAMSINVKEIVADPHLPPRAAGAVVTLSTPMVFSILLLDPVQSSSALGVELIVLAILVGVALGAMLRPRRGGQGRVDIKWVGGNALPSVLLVGSILLAGVGILSTSVRGLAWLTLAAIAAIFGGLLQAWVLLIEIRR